LRHLKPNYEFDQRHGQINRDSRASHQVGLPLLSKKGRVRAVEFMGEAAERAVK
jgi:hypothetical protein